MQNRFEQFSQNIIAMHTGSAGAFDPARMMFPPEEKEASSQEMQNLYMTNVYRNSESDRRKLSVSSEFSVSDADV